jgi:transposase-like protein
MAARKRDSVERSASSESTMTYSRFLELFPDNRACLDYLRDRFFPTGTECPSCGKPSKFHALSGRSAYSCQYCRHQVYPTAGTIFHKTTTSLQLWFFAIYLMSSTRCGISAKQLEREIGVTYKTAHRMFKQIRTLLSEEGSGPLSGDVEVDETFIGGRPRAAVQRAGKSWERRAQKPIVVGMVERGGRIKTTVVRERSEDTLKGTIRQHVLPASMIFTDEHASYVGIGREYQGHRRIHHLAKVYVDGSTHTQTIEGFFGLFKNGVRGVYHAISARYLQNYLDEYSFRYNRRDSHQPMFWAILDQVRQDEPVAP